MSFWPWWMRKDARNVAMMITIRLQECPIVWLALLDEFFLSFFSFFYYFEKSVCMGQADDDTMEKRREDRVREWWLTRAIQIYILYIFFWKISFWRALFTIQKKSCSTPFLSLSRCRTHHTHITFYTWMLPSTEQRVVVIDIIQMRCVCYTNGGSRLFVLHVCLCRIYS